tara:strand:+ start:61 stop:552 length:492 start_codon:yes stop_codon:yes gene_type:complete
MYFVFKSNLGNELINCALKFYLEKIETVAEIYCNIVDGGKIDFYEGLSCLNPIERALLTKSDINISVDMKRARDSFFIERNQEDGVSFGEAAYDGSGRLINRPNDEGAGYPISREGPLYNDILEKLTLPKNHKISLFKADIEENRELVFHGSWPEFRFSDLMG